MAVIIASASTIIATIGVLQWAGLDVLTFGGYAIRWGTMVPAMRLYSTFGNPNLAAGYLAGAVFLSAALVVSATAHRLKTLGIVSVVVTLIAMIGMNSQGAWLGLGFGVIVAFAVVTRTKLPVLVLITVLLLPVGFFAATHSTSLEGRMVMWRSSWPMFFEHPAIGSGWGSFQLHYPELQAQFLTAHPEYSQFWTYTDLLHNDPLQILLEGGIVALAALVWVLWSFANELRKSFALASHSERIWLACTAGGVTSILANACFNFQFAVPPTLILFFTLLAVPYILHAKADTVPFEVRMPRLFLQSAAAAVLVGVAVWLGLGIWHRAQASHFEAMGLQMEGLGVVTKSEELYRRGLEVEPEDGNLQYALSRALYVGGKYDEALRFALLAQHTVADPHLEVLKARIQDGIGLRSEALTSYQRALWLDPSLDSVKPDIERLRH
jgi:O-antigen ligase